MGIHELTDNELAWRMGQMTSDRDRYSEPFSQYASELYERFSQQAVNIACYYGLRRDDANDAVQAAFIKAFRSMASYNKDKDFKNWFFKIVLNCVRDIYKNKKKHNHTDIDTADTIQDNFSKEFHISMSIKGIINSLPEKVKETLILKVYAGMDMTQISKSLSISVRQVHNRLNQAYVMIRKKVEEEELI